ncbi:MAG: hypothetical protein IMZ50_10090 [Candidatus Atribacteria bacterium]|nr:hypothetical protein [Candidatus Atribacteria bacterium]
MTNRDHLRDQLEPSDATGKRTMTNHQHAVRDVRREMEKVFAANHERAVRAVRERIAEKARTKP